jgi:pyruvate-ferredoxin/flavodoxin oxidoreductase
MKLGADQQRLAVDSGIWPLYRFDPHRLAKGEAPLKLDSGAIKVTVFEYMRTEARFRMVERMDKDRFKRLAAEAQDDAHRRFALYKQLAGISVPARQKDGPEDESKDQPVPEAATAAAVPARGGRGEH